MSISFRCSNFSIFFSSSAMCDAAESLTLFCVCVDVCVVVVVVAFVLEEEKGTEQAAKAALAISSLFNALDLLFLFLLNFLS